MENSRQKIAASMLPGLDKRLATTLGREKNFNDDFVFVLGDITVFGLTEIVLPNSDITLLFL